MNAYFSEFLYRNSYLEISDKLEKQTFFYIALYSFKCETAWLVQSTRQFL